MEMTFDDSQSVDCALLTIDSNNLHNDRLNQSMILPSNKPIRNNVKWTIRNSVSSASLRRYRSPFRRNEMNSSSVHSQNSQTYSFPLFRHFYVMRTSLKDKRQRFLRNNTITRDSLLSEIFHSAPRIEIRHVITTMLIIIASAFLLIFMIILDMAYLNDAISNIVNHPTKTIRNTLCFRYPKICIMKGLVIIVFIGITIILCYSILILYTRARRHSRLLERKTDELEKEKCLTQKLLHQILPPCVAKDLINGRKAPAEYYDSVTVYFSDIVGFTGIAR
jgi:hypothetical protein